MLNGGNISRLIEVLEEGQFSVEDQLVGFNMGTYVGVQDPSGGLIDHGPRNCDTVACIAGHAYLLATGFSLQRAIDETDAGTIETVAAEFLGLSHDQASDLFFDLPPEMALTEVTSEQAVAALRHLLATGEVSWIPP